VKQVEDNAWGTAVGASSLRSSTPVISLAEIQKEDLKKMKQEEAIQLQTLKRTVNEHQQQVSSEQNAWAQHSSSIAAKKKSSSNVNFSSTMKTTYPVSFEAIFKEEMAQTDKNKKSTKTSSYADVASAQSAWGLSGTSASHNNNNNVRPQQVSSISADANTNSGSFAVSSIVQQAKQYQKPQVTDKTVVAHPQQKQKTPQPSKKKLQSSLPFADATFESTLSADTDSTSFWDETFPTTTKTNHSAATTAKTATITAANGSVNNKSNTKNNSNSSKKKKEKVDPSLLVNFTTVDPLFHPDE